MRCDLEGLSRQSISHSASFQSVVVDLVDPIISLTASVSHPTNYNHNSQYPALHCSDIFRWRKNIHDSGIRSACCLIV